jgi:hypothetical protein
MVRSRPVSGLASTGHTQDTLRSRRLDPLDVAIVETLAYADLFDWPLSPAEIHRYLPVAARLDDVEAALASPMLSAVVSTIGAFHVLRGREHLAAERERKAARSARLWSQAVRYGRVVASLPWVRLVAVTGSLAVGAAADDADIDLFIVAADGRLWLARAMTIGVAKVATRLPSTRGVRLCPNYLLTASALDLPERDLYTAHELAQLVPLFGPDAYRSLMERNAWYREWLPNHGGYTGPIAPLGGRSLNRRLEPLFANRLVARVERWERERKVARLRRPTTGETRFDETICKGHFEGYRAHVLDTYAARMTELFGDDP